MIPPQGSERGRRREPEGSRARGFTLIEIIITLAIVGILALIAYPAYTSSVYKSRRADGQAAVAAAMQAEERYFTENNAYDTTLSDLGYPAGTVTSQQGFYVITVAAGSTGNIATSVVVTGTPVNSDPDCGSLSMNNQYQTSATGNNPGVCWQTN